MNISESTGSFFGGWSPSEAGRLEGLRKSNYGNREWGRDPWERHAKNEAIWQGVETAVNKGLKLLFSGGL